VRVLFVYPDLSSTMTNYTGVLSQGVALLSAELRQHGHETALLHVTQLPERESYIAAVRAASPDLVGFSVNSHYAQRLAGWVGWTREAVDVPIAVGGVHATVAPDEIAAGSDVDFICVGEGDEALPELCATLASGKDPAHVANFWVRTTKGWIVNKPRPVVADLDTLPDPDYGLFGVGGLYNVRRGFFPFLMSRGCAFRCTYCCCDVLRQRSAGGGRYWRFRSPESAVAQLRRLLDRHPVPVDAVQIVDTILFPNKPWLRRFAPAYRETIGLPLNTNLRADMIDEEVVDLLAQCGCRTARLGVESGDAWMTSEVLNRQLEIDEIRGAFGLLERAGIERWAYNMVGLPYENLRRALATVRLNGEIGPDLAIPFIFYPYPGTRLHEICGEEGWLSSREFDHYFHDVMLDQPGFSRGDVLFLHRFFRPLIKVYSVARHWPDRRRRTWMDGVDAVLRSPLLPRGTIANGYDHYKGLRHRVGEALVHRSPRLYRLLGGTDPV